MKFEPYFKQLLLSLQAFNTSVLINSGGNELTKSQGETQPFYFIRERSLSFPKSPHLSQIE